MSQFNSLDDVLGVLRRRLALIVGITLIGAALSLVYATSLPRSYETTAVIQIELSDLAENTRGQSAVSRAKYRLNLIRQQLMARDSILAVIDELNLFDDTDMPVSEKIDTLRESVSIEQIVDPAEAWRPDAMPSGLVITVRLGDPEQAALVANTFLDRILQQSEERRQAQTTQALGFFEGEAERIGAKIAALEAEISRFKQQNADALPAGVTALRGQLATLKATELEIERQIIGLRANSGRLREDALARQVKELEDQKDLVGARIAEIERAILAAPEVEREFNRLNRDLKQLQDQFSVITTRRAEAEMEQMLEASQVSERFEVLEVALVPEYPVSPSRKKIAVAGTALFLALGAGMAVLLEILNPAIRTASQLEAETGVAPIVAIPDLDRRGGSSGWRGRLAWLAAILAAFALAALAWLGKLPTAMRLAGGTLPRLPRQALPQAVPERMPEAVKVPARLR